MSGNTTVLAFQMANGTPVYIEAAEDGADREIAALPGRLPG